MPLTLFLNWRFGLLLIGLCVVFAVLIAFILSWHALFVPKATPTAIINRLNAAVAEALANPTVRRRLADFGLDIPPRDQQRPEVLATIQKAEIEKWWPMITEAGIKAE